MNVKRYCCLLLVSAITLPAFAASEIFSESAGMLKTGNVSVFGKSTADEAVLSLRNKAELAGADYFRVNRLTTPGDSSRWSANAVLYKNS
ncbi:YdgH/BhsA/McbA-like domain containing protein [[Enterobacter] lignolyticus]|uniref:YdgH/BhsA/McbA-like domain-containing protein n=1 Tax=[Enterobacter] lignolyticus TaxID=1334193 RepID=A0A806X8L9_9ENTR|nr:YdgH/BhsA/McbA-like domain containing protein [[Enterobacter] lignolyticus]ALR78530.1 hypothetical protein AO703_20290 [[Enterobacter] lignolyticus]